MRRRHAEGRTEPNRQIGLQGDRLRLGAACSAPRRDPEDAVGKPSANRVVASHIRGEHRFSRSAGASERHRGFKTHGAGFAGRGDGDETRLSAKEAIAAGVELSGTSEGMSGRRGDLVEPSDFFFISVSGGNAARRQVSAGDCWTYREHASPSRWLMDTSFRGKLALRPAPGFTIRLDEIMGRAFPRNEPRVGRWPSLVHSKNMV